MVNKLEVLWTLTVVGLIAGVSVYSTILVYKLDALPNDPTEYVEVIGHQWYWEFCYSNATHPYHPCYNSSYDAATGSIHGGALWAAPGSQIQVNVTGADVIHSFNIPQLGIRIDAIPGRVNHFAFNVPNAPAGTRYLIQCTEFCGAGHGTMRSYLVLT
jgi:heme/copper-type cytochrome/quinol oxidase subunit 2